MKANSLLRFKRTAWLAICFCAAALLLVAVHSSAKPALKKAPLPEVEVVPVRQEDVPLYSQWVGTLDGLINADVKAQVSGYLLRQDYKEGSFVRKGQLLFEIDPRPFQATLDQVRAQLAQAKAQLAQDKAQLASAEADEIRTQLNVDKYTPLAKAKAASQQDLDNATQTNLANQAKVQTAKAAIELAQAQIRAAEAAVETATINLSFTRLTSPIDGIAGRAQLQVGALVGPSSPPVTTVSTVNPIKVYFNVSEREYLELNRPFRNETGRDQNKKSLPLQLILADGTTYPYQGVFSYADREVDQNTGTIQMAGLFPNPGNILRPGGYGQVRAITQVRKNVLLVPQRAVAELQGSYQVAVVGSNNRVSIRTVAVGQRVGSLWIIDQGLKPGDRVITEGFQKVHPGMEVDPKPFAGGTTNLGPIHPPCLRSRCAAAA